MNAKQMIQVDDSVIEYTVKRSRRRKKTVQVSISGGKVEVSAPLRTPGQEIQAILVGKASWILDKLAASDMERPPLSLVTGETLPYFGSPVGLIVEADDVRNPEALLKEDQLLVRVPLHLPEEERRESALSGLVLWYKTGAADFLVRSVSRWLPVMGRTEKPRVLVRDQRSRWGSCSSDGTLRFSWRLAMVEPELIESVVVHELAHLDVMNHSRDFWDVVLRAMPDARERRKRLQQAGRLLPL